MDIIVDVLFLSRAPHHLVYFRRSVLCSVAAAAGCNARTAPHCWSLHARAKMAKPIPIPRSSLVSSPLLSSPLLSSSLFSSPLLSLGAFLCAISSANTNVFLCKMRSSNFAHFDTHHGAHLGLTWGSLGAHLGQEVTKHAFLQHLFSSSILKCFFLMIPTPNVT